MASSSTPEKTTENSASERFVSLTDEDVERFVKPEANKNAQRKMHSDVALMSRFCQMKTKQDNSKTYCRQN